MSWRGRGRREDKRPPVWEKDVWDKVDRIRRSRSRSRDRDRNRYDRDINRDYERKNREYERDRHDRSSDRRDRFGGDRFESRAREDREPRREKDGRDNQRRERRISIEKTETRNERKRTSNATGAAHDWSQYNYDVRGSSEEKTLDESPIREVEMEDSFTKTEERVEAPPPPSIQQPLLGDWYCHCGAFNFKRRSHCYKEGCNGVRTDTAPSGDDNEDRSSGISCKLIFKKLDALTNEEIILSAIKERRPDIAEKITGITVGRDMLTGVSKGMAYVTFNSLVSSTEAYQQLTTLEPKLMIDDRTVNIKYYKEIIEKKQNPTYRSATNYLRDNSFISETDRVNAAAAVAQSAINAKRKAQTVTSYGAAPNLTMLPPVSNPPTGDGTTVFPAPNVQTFLYDESSGYYYDPSTGLYYDGATQYFYNAALSKYIYWDATKMVYHAAPQQTSSTPQEVTKEEPLKEEKKKVDTQDKVKVAKKIAKEMEKWARTLNQKKESARANIVLEQPRDTGPSVGSADIGFSVLGSKTSTSSALQTFAPSVSPPPQSAEEFLMKTPNIDYEEGVFDWDKLACLLCKRQFPSMDVLKKHRDLSELHKTNLEAHRKTTEDSLADSLIYRDRAAERRLKFGEASPPKPKYRHQMPIFNIPINPQPSEKIVDGIGSKMLEKMGWSEGKGLGKQEQGRTAPIEAERRPGTAGLGQKKGIYTAAPGETYRDTVKKLAIARYNDLLSEEN